MDSAAEWTILGNHRVADSLRSVARHVETQVPITIATEPGDVPSGAFAIGPAVLYSDVKHVAPYFSAFEAIEEVQRALDAGEVGRIYGCYTSFRIARNRTAEEVALNCLLPALAVTLDLFSQSIIRVHATRSSLLNVNDGWFVTLRYEDDTIATIEALAVLDPDAALTHDMLVEVTASDRVLRAEPMRQAVHVERLNGRASVHPWWEDLNERFLKFVAHRALQPDPNAGPRLRAVWAAIQESAETGEAVTI